VLLRSPDGYRSYLEEAFNRAGIPAHFARGAVRPDPAGRAFCALLKCAADGLSARRFAEYLSLGQVPDATSDGVPPEAIPDSERWVSPDSEFAQSSTDEVAEELRPTQPAEDETDEAPVREGQLRAPRRWERLLVEAAVIGGRDRWRRRIEGLVNDIRLRLSELAEEDETQAAVLARTLEDLAAFAAYAIPLIDLLDGPPKSASWGEWLDQLGALATRALARGRRGGLKIRKAWTARALRMATRQCRVESDVAKPIALTAWSCSRRRVIRLGRMPVVGASAALTQKALPKAIQVADRWHLMEPRLPRCRVFGGAPTGEDSACQQNKIGTAFYAALAAALMGLIQ